MRIPKHTCADKLISIEDDAAWAKAMATKKTCPACQYKRGIMESAQAMNMSVNDLIDAITKREFNLAEDLRIEKLAKAMKATGKPRVTIIRGKAKAPKGVQY